MEINVYVPFIHKRTQFKDTEEFLFRNVVLFINVNAGSLHHTYNNIAVREMVVILQWKTWG